MYFRSQICSNVTAMPPRQTCPDNVAVASALSAMRIKPNACIKHIRPQKVKVQTNVRVKSVARVREDALQPALAQALAAKKMEEIVPVLSETGQSKVDLRQIAPLTSKIKATKVDRSRRSWLHERYDVLRNDGVKLSLTPQFMALFYDLTVPQAIDVLCIPSRTMRRLRVWCGLSRWPRQLVLDRKHPVLNAESVRSERKNIMQWAWDNRDPMLYGMLYRAHQYAGCSMRGVPLPPVWVGEGTWRFPDSVAPGELLTQSSVGVASLVTPAVGLPVIAAVSAAGTAAVPAAGTAAVSAAGAGTEAVAPAGTEAVALVGTAAVVPVPIVSVAGESALPVDDFADIDWDNLFNCDDDKVDLPGAAFDKAEDEEWRRFFERKAEQDAKF